MTLYLPLFNCGDYNTPKHGSWLDMAEIEIGILCRQALAKPLPDFVSRFAPGRFAAIPFVLRSIGSLLRGTPELNSPDFTPLFFDFWPDIVLYGELQKIQFSIYFLV